jgi:Tfp pilus assembly protein PilN
MIEINLLPAELRVAHKSKKISIDFKPNKLLSFIPILVGLIVLIHIFLAIGEAVKASQYRTLKNKLLKLEPQRKELEDFNKEHTILLQDAQTIQQMIGQRIIWSQKLNRLSMDLPSGIWFSDLAVTQKDFTLLASAVSLNKEEMNIITKLIDNLKNDPVFIQDFNSLELNSVQRRGIGGYDVIDFILTGALKPK